MGFVGGLGAAGTTAYVGTRDNSRRMDADIRARWDAALLDRSSELAAAVRSVRHLSERYQRSLDKDQQRVKIDQAHEQARVLSEQLRLVGDRRVQIAGRRVLHHLYAVRVYGEEERDPRHEDYPDTTPVGRLNDALQEFYRAVRGQLNAKSPEDVVHDDDLQTISASIAPLSVSSRSTSS